MNQRPAPRFTPAKQPAKAAPAAPITPPRPDAPQRASGPSASAVASLSAMEGMLADSAREASKSKPASASDEPLELDEVEETEKPAAGADGAQTTYALDPELEAARKKYAKLRKDIEARSGVLDYSTILFDGSITQEVIITPNVLTVVFGSLTEPQSLFAFEQARAAASQDQTLFFRALALNELTLGIRKLIIINKEQPLPSAMSASEGSLILDGPALQKRVEAFKVPIEWYRLIGANFHWFRERVARAVEGPELGNG